MSDIVKVRLSERTYYLSENPRKHDDRAMASFVETTRHGQMEAVPWIIGTRHDGSTVEINVAAVETIERRGPSDE